MDDFHEVLISWEDWLNSQNIADILEFYNLFLHIWPKSFNFFNKYNFNHLFIYRILLFLFLYLGLCLNWKSTKPFSWPLNVGLDLSLCDGCAAWQSSWSCSWSSWLVYRSGLPIDSASENAFPVNGHLYIFELLIAFSTGCKPSSWWCLRWCRYKTWYRLFEFCNGQQGNQVIMCLIWWKEPSHQILLTAVKLSWVSVLYLKAVVIIQCRFLYLREIFCFPELVLHWHHWKILRYIIV